MRPLHFLLLFFLPLFLPAQHDVAGTGNIAKQARVKTLTVRSRLVHDRPMDTLDIERIISSSFKVYHYDTNGLPVKCVRTDGGRLFTTYYHYDAGGKLLADSTFGEDSTLSVTRYEYDAQGRLSRTTQIDQKEKWKQRVLRSYPGSKFAPDTVVRLYSYPSAAKMVVRESSGSDTSVSRYVTKKPGKLLLIEKGRPRRCFKTEYDDSRQPVKEKTYAGRRLYSWRTYQYNEKGLVVKSGAWDRRTGKEAHIETYYEYAYY